MRTAASTCAFWPGSGILALGLAVGLAGCTASADDVKPPQDQLFFPTGLAVSVDPQTDQRPEQRTLFVANANSELRFDSGSIGVIDLSPDSVLGKWLANPDQPLSDCTRDPDHSETLVCDEAQFFKKDAGVRIGNFATDLAIQNFTGGSHLTRVFVPTRGDPSISWADFFNGSLHCTVGTDTYALCDDAHRLTSVANDPDQLPVPTEPFGVFADARNGFAMVTHLTSASVTLIRSPSVGPAVVADVIANVFAPDAATGLRGASGIAGRNPNTADDQVYVGATSEDRIQTFTVGTRDNAAAFLLPGSYFFLDAVGGTAGGSTGGSTDTRGMQFSPTGDRLYIANRNPPTLQVYDTSLGPDGVPRNAATGASDICREASAIAVLDAGAGERVYVTCFQDGQIYVVDPSGQSQVEDIISVGRGPYGAAVLGQNPSDRKFLFVTNFLEDTIAVIDLNLDSPTRNRVVLRIGTPKAPS